MDRDPPGHRSERWGQGASAGSQDPQQSWAAPSPAAPGCPACTSRDPGASTADHGAGAACKLAAGGGPVYALWRVECEEAARKKQKVAGSSVRPHQPSARHSVTYQELVEAMLV
ncbi:unnamed protein product [Rangifer tarandus platyrhynchus]|uniref:Uncharacterized protein n=1 Tax=Rangifer tarandus platyrhynchus TaxID=3082113 RepID=A0AC60A928_RANTA